MSMSRSSTRVFALEVTGRHAGWAAAACALAADDEGAAPHVLLMPEVVFNQGRFLTKIEKVFPLANIQACLDASALLFIR